MASIYSVPQNFSTTLNVGGGINNSQTSSIVLTSVTGLPTDGGILAFDWANPIDTTTIEYIEYTGISGNTLTGVIRGAEGVSAKAHSNGCTVVGIISQAHIKRLKEKLDGTDATGINPATVKVGGVTAIDTSAYATVAKALRSATTTVDTSAATAPTSGQVLTATASTTATWQTPSAATDGWTSDSNTWTYVSASSFKVTGSNVTTQFPAGTRVKCTNNATTFYGTVQSSSFSSDTTVTLIPNNDYSLANSAITAPYYSYQINPQGYPTWFSYTPTWGGVTIGNATNVGKFSVVGKTIEITAYMNAGSTTSYSGSMTFGLPCNSAADNATTKYPGWGYGQAGGTVAQGYAIVNGDATNTASIFEFSTSTGQTAWTATVPTTWGTTSIFSIWLRYRFA